MTLLLGSTQTLSGLYLVNNDIPVTMVGLTPTYTVRKQCKQTQTNERAADADKLLSRRVKNAAVEELFVSSVFLHLY